MVAKVVAMQIQGVQYRLFLHSQRQICFLCFWQTEFNNINMFVSNGNIINLYYPQQPFCRKEFNFIKLPNSKCNAIYQVYNNGLYSLGLLIMGFTH